MRRLAFCLITLLSAVITNAQDSIYYSNFSSAGGTETISENESFKVYGVIGQPIAISSVTRTQTQAGFLQLVDIVVPDEEPPLIEFDLTAATLVKNANNSLEIEVDDNYTRTPTVTVHYRKISTGAFSEAPMTATSETSYSVSIPAAWHDNTGLEFYFSSKDNAGNESRNPDIGSHFLYLSVPSVEIHPALLAFGDAVTDYRILTVPYQLTNNGIAQIFDELGPSDKTKYRIYRYNDEWLEYPSITTLNRAEGFFIIMSNELSDVSLGLGQQQAPENNRSSLYEMMLQPGWNLIGNPYTEVINWPDVKDFNFAEGIELGDLKMFTGSANDNGYANADDVAAFQGGFVFWDGNSPQSIVIPFKGQTATGGRNGFDGDFTTDLDAERWKVNLTLSDGVISNRLGGFGMHPDADISKDRFDDLNPPHFEHFVEVNFPHPEYPVGSFCRDIVPVSPDYVWHFDVTTGNECWITLRWDEGISGSSDRQLTLFDEVDQRVIDMRSENHYSLQVKKEHSLSIYFGGNAIERILPSKVTISPAYPNPLRGSRAVNFTVSLPDYSDSYLVRTQIFDAAGNRVADSESTLQPGIATVSCSLEASTARGLHMYKIAVDGNGFRQEFHGKLIVE